MMNHRQTHLRPGPACAAVAPLVALVVGQKRLDRQEARALQAHLETCAYCQAELDSYQWLDGALARHFAPPEGDPLSPDEISAIIAQTAQPPVKSSVRSIKSASRAARRPLAPLPEPPGRRGHALISVLSALAAVVLIAAVGLALFISHAPPQPGRNPTPTPTPGPRYFPQAKDTLSSIYMVSASDGWAVGSRFLDAGIRKALFLRYNGSYWEEASGPSSQDLQAASVWLARVVMVSATEGWAIGGGLSNTTGQTPFAFILHYTGGRWTVQQKFSDIELNDLAMLSASEGWAVGATVLPPNADGIQRGVLLHYSGGAWQPVTIAASGSTLAQVVMTSPDDGWIVGATQSSASPVWHYNGSAWMLVSVSAMDVVNMIAPVSASDVWAVGFNFPPKKVVPGGAHGGGFKTVFAHYDGKTWTAVQTPVSGKDIEITDLVMDAANDGWAFPFTGGATSGTSLYLHYTGGRWQEVAGPETDEALNIFMLSASDGWAVGSSGSILHYHDGAWNPVVSP